MPLIFGFATMGAAAASVDCHLRVWCVRLRVYWVALLDANEREARIAQRRQVMDMATDV